MKLHTIKRNPACNGRTISVRPGVGSSERARVVSGWTGAVPLAVAGLVRFVCAGDPVPMKISPMVHCSNSAMSWNERLMPGARAGGPGGAGAGADLSTADLSTGQ